MTWRLYIVPKTRIDLGNGQEYVAPKYFFSRLTTGLIGMENVYWAWEVYAWENHGILAADVTDAQHALIDAQTDVIIVPALDNTIPNAMVRNRVRNILEAGNIPGMWINTGMTYRHICRTILNIFKFHNRYVSKGGRLGDHGINLDTTSNQLSSVARIRLQITANEFGLNYFGVSGTTTMRQILKGMADQFGDREYRLGGLII